MEVALPKIIGKNIRKHLKMQGLTAHSLGARIGVSGNTIGRMINGTGKSLQWTTVENIAQALHTEVSQFFYEAGNTKEYTGIASIDERVPLIVHNLFNGSEGYERIKKFFCDDYRLTYADVQWGQEARLGPTLREELITNDVAIINYVEVHSVSIVNEMICIYETISEIIEADHGAIPNPRAKQNRIAKTLDYWTPDVSIEKIVKGKDWRIEKRAVNVLSIEIQ
ncbi:MAG: helix-turn-helix transcriptional regulator [Candidatus Latescibacterota bacterium]|nr:helix-turn-helix transcriptional regulator [Candidatus Latescibacterota bacterium]